MNLSIVPKPRTTSENGGPASVLVSVFDEVRSRRAARAADRRLREELADFDTPAAVADLMATLTREDSADAEYVRDILSHNLVATGRHPA